jgi:tetratricopeptide (TPR) repeat protein
MTIHPDAENLGRFVEGTLPDTERPDVVAHIADCDECRVVVVDGAEFIEAPHDKRSYRWLAVAAVLIVVISSWAYIRYETNPVNELAVAYGRLDARPIAGRLSSFPYVPLKTTRGAGKRTDPAELVLEGKAATVARRQGSDAKSLHSRGVAHLLTGDTGVAATELTDAADADPSNALYWNDVSAALLAAQHPAQALSAAGHALALSPGQHEAQFNRALALEALGQSAAARQAYDDYLTGDPASAWAGEVQRNRRRLNP